MDDDAAWTRWLEGLADPAAPVEVVLAGRYRQADWDMGRRVLPEHMLHLIREGGQTGAIAGRPVRTSPGDALWVPAGTAQELRRRDDVRLLAKCNVRFTATAPPPPLPTVVHAAAALGPHLDALRREWTARQSGRDQRLRALLVLLFSDLRRLAERGEAGLPAAAQARLLELVDGDPAARPHPAALARELGLTPTWFARLFRRTYGCAPRAWLVRHRIARAAERLEVALSVGAVAAEFGYADLFLFSRQFRAVMGCAPRAWLAQAGSAVTAAPAPRPRGRRA